jgi:hypothetical protein
MLPLFLGLTLVNLLCLSLATFLGFTRPGAMHVLFGALAALVCVGVHCVVFTYFIATAKWVQHAVAVKKLDATLTAPTRSFKMQAFPAALSAMAITFIAAMLGAALDNRMGSKQWHLAAALAAVAVNVAVAIIEYRAIARNSRLIDSILEQINAPPARAPQVSPPPP